MKSLGNDAFLVIYGGGDTDMAAIKIQVVVAAAPNTYRNRTCWTWFQCIPKPF